MDRINCDLKLDKDIFFIHATRIQKSPMPNVMKIGRKKVTNALKKNFDGKAFCIVKLSEIKQSTENIYSEASPMNVLGFRNPMRYIG